MTPQQRAAAVDARFAERVRMVREARGMSRQQLADTMEISYEALRYIEGTSTRRGKRQGVHVGQALVFAEVLGVPLEWMTRPEPLPTEALMGPVTS